MSTRRWVMWHVWINHVTPTNRVTNLPLCSIHSSLDPRFSTCLIQYTSLMAYSWNYMPHEVYVSASFGVCHTPPHSVYVSASFGVCHTWGLIRSMLHTRPHSVQACSLRLIRCMPHASWGVCFSMAHSVYVSAWLFRYTPNELWRNIDSSSTRLIDA